MFENLTGNAAIVTYVLLIAGALFLMAVFRSMLRIQSSGMRRYGNWLRTSQSRWLVAPFIAWGAGVAELLTPYRYRDWLRRQLSYADLSPRFSAEFVEALQGLAASVFAALGVVWWLLEFRYVWLMFVLMVAVPLVIGYWVYSSAQSRLSMMRRALPFLIDLMAVSVEAGMAFQQALRNAIANSERQWNRTGGGGERTTGERELSREMGLMLTNLNLGYNLPQALNEAADRIHVEEFRNFAMALLHSERIGAPITETLRRQSRELRTRIQMRVEEQAAKAPVKILFPMVIFIGPPTIFVILGPIAAKIVDTITGF